MKMDWEFTMRRPQPLTEMGVLVMIEVKRVGGELPAGTTAPWSVMVFGPG